jgi:hypothetical protein
MTNYPEGIPEDICKMFETLALEVAGMGFDRYSARAILHRLRWHYHVDKGDREFKCNNNWTARLARWFLGQHPDMPGFFALRERDL